eukprot:scaffold286288_cov15-Tisochrysis_lutea.AAC.1
MQYGSPGSDGVWKLEAEVEGCRSVLVKVLTLEGIPLLRHLMQADVVQFMHGRSEMAMCMWVKGCPESFEFRWVTKFRRNISGCEKGLLWFAFKKVCSKLVGLVGHMFLSPTSSAGTFLDSKKTGGAP